MSEPLEKEVQLHERNAQGQDVLIYPLPPGGYPLAVSKGGTGADSAAEACESLGAVKKSGDTMTGNLSITGYLYPSVYLMPTYNGVACRGVIEGSYVGAASFSVFEDASGLPVELPLHFADEVAQIGLNLHIRVECRLVQFLRIDIHHDFTGFPRHGFEGVTDDPDIHA